MLNRKVVKAIKQHKVIIMFVFMAILMIILAYWVADRLIKHLDYNMPGF